MRKSLFLLIFTTTLFTALHAQMGTQKEVLNNLIGRTLSTEHEENKNEQNKIAKEILM